MNCATVRSRHSSGEKAVPQCSGTEGNTLMIKYSISSEINEALLSSGLCPASTASAVQLSWLSYRLLLQRQETAQVCVVQVQGMCRLSSLSKLDKGMSFTSFPCRGHAMHFYRGLLGSHSSSNFYTSLKFGWNWPKYWIFETYLQTATALGFFF